MKAGLTLLILLLLVAASPVTASAQTRKTVKPAANNTIAKQAAKNSAGYYLDVFRPNCCQLRIEQWQEIAKRLRPKGIPAFFGIYEVLDFREEWHPVKLKQTGDDEGMLILGPFATPADARRALSRLPVLLPKNGDDFNGVQMGPTGDKQTWQIGMYQISGFRTSQSVAVQKPRAKKAGVIEGVVVENTGGANWIGIVVESGGVRYSIQLGGNSYGIETLKGDVETIGNRVRVVFKDSEKLPDGTYYLKATSVVQIR